MNRWKGKVAVVTGASSGIGLAIARAFIREGLTVIGLARRKEEMEMQMENEKKEGKFHGIKCDITDKHVIDVFKQIKRDSGVIQILVNNAGMVTLGSLYGTSRNDWQRVFDTNVMGLLECTKQIVLMLKEANVEGHIVNINSIQGYRVYNLEPITSNVYAASKHAVTAITETLRNDLLNTKIRVTSINPSLTYTNILQNTKFDIKTLKQSTLKPEDVAESVVYAVGTPEHVQVTELTIRSMGEYRK